MFSRNEMQYHRLMTEIDSRFGNGSLRPLNGAIAAMELLNLHIRKCSTGLERSMDFFMMADRYVTGFSTVANIYAQTLSDFGFICERYGPAINAGLSRNVPFDLTSELTGNASAQLEMRSTSHRGDDLVNLLHQAMFNPDLQPPAELPDVGFDYMPGWYANEEDLKFVVRQRLYLRIDV